MSINVSTRNVLRRISRNLLIPTIAVTLAILQMPTARSQGCVAIRGSGMCALGNVHGMTNLVDLKWQALVSYRWLHSDRHFRGTHEEPNRQAAGTEVINDSHFIDVGIAYAITPRYSAALILPFVHHDRSSLYEHPRSGRNSTSATGIGDVRFGLYAWLLDPMTMPQGNVQLGIGMKAPTGDYSATDTYMSNNLPVVGFVDQSIQPGDGGWGFTLEMNSYVEVIPRWQLFAQGFYLFNPSNVNGTPTRTGGGLRGNPFENVMSIPDQYFGRVGINHILIPKWNVAINLAGRIEGVPVRDAIGSNDGFRRPGYAVSIEPGINWMPGRWQFALSAPVRVHANRLRSVADERWTESSGVFRHGDAAFADFLISFNVGRQF